MLQFGRHVKLTDAIQMYYGWGSGGEAPVAEQFSQFFEKITTLRPFESHFERF